MPCFCSSLCVGHSTIHMLLIIICRLAALLCLFFVLSVYCFLVCCIVLCPIASNILLHFSLFIVRYYTACYSTGCAVGSTMVCLLLGCGDFGIYGAALQPVGYLFC